MKTALKISLVVAVISIISCKKEESAPSVQNPTTNTDTYSSLSDFYSKNGVPKQTFTINASVGGSFITPQSTTVNIPANAFVNAANVPVTGTVAIEFKDIYTKSDMLLSDMGTQQPFSGPLESAGEFFIKAIANNIAVQIDTAKKIVINQPVMAGAVANPSMAAFVEVPDSANHPEWWPAPVIQAAVAVSTVALAANQYVFSLYSFSMPTSSGSWCNSDNSSFFAGYPKTNLTIHANFATAPYGFNLDVFLIFKNINSMVHVYNNYGTDDFPYYYAPLGLQCTVVTVGTKDGKLYSSFAPITISASQTVNFNVTETTTEAFKTALKALN